MQNNNSTNRERAQMFRSDGQMIGGIVGDVFRKHVDASKHFLRRPPSIAFDRDVLMQAKEQGAQIAEVIDRESGKTYRATIARIWKNGFSVNRGHGAQMALALTEWNHDDEPIQGRLF